MMRIHSISTGLIVCLIALTSTAAKAQSDLQTLSQQINTVVSDNANELISTLSETMTPGQMQVVAHDLADQYRLDPQIVDQFNQAYVEELAASTHEAQTMEIIDNEIAVQEEVFEVAKQEVIAEAKVIMEVTAIAEEISTAPAAQKIEIEAHAQANGLGDGIQADTVTKLNHSIDDMVTASRTKNLIESYSVAMVDTTEFYTQATGTVQQFFDQAHITLDQLNPNQINVTWGDQILSIEGQFIAEGMMQEFTEGLAAR